MQPQQCNLTLRCQQQDNVATGLYADGRRQTLLRAWKTASQVHDNFSSLSFVVGQGVLPISLFTRSMQPIGHILVNFNIVSSSSWAVGDFFWYTKLPLRHLLRISLSYRRPRLGRSLHNGPCLPQRVSIATLTLIASQGEPSLVASPHKLLLLFDVILVKLHHDRDSVVEAREQSNVSCGCWSFGDATQGHQVRVACTLQSMWPNDRAMIRWDLSSY